MFMLETLLRNVLNKPATRNYPHEKRTPFAGYRGRLYIHIDECIFCRTCQRKCPAQCITSDPRSATWTVDPFECVNCGVCVDNCPTKCLFLDMHHRKPAPEKYMTHTQGEPRHRAVGVKAKKEKEEKLTEAAPDLPPPTLPESLEGKE